MPIQNISTHSGAVVGTNWKAAFDAAYDAIKTTGGTINVDADTQIETNIDLAPASYVQYVPLILRGDGGGVITCKGPAQPIFNFNGNKQSVTVRDLTFLGNAITSQVDANYRTNTYVMALQGVNFNLVENCDFQGLSTTTQLIWCINRPATIRNCEFGGCAASVAHILAETSALVVDNCRFDDYGNFRNTYYDKAGTRAAWISAITPGSGTGANVHNITVRNSSFDEGALIAIKVDGYKRTFIENCSINNSGTAGGTGIYLEDVDYAIISNCNVGYTVGDTLAVDLVNCGDVLIENLRTDTGVHRVQATKNTRVTVVNSPGVTLEYV